MGTPFLSGPIFDQELNSTSEPHFVSLGVGMNGAEISLLSDGSASFGNFINFYAGDIAGYAKFGSAEVSLSGDAKFKSLSLSGASVDSLGSASFSNGLVTIDSLGNVFSGGFFTSSDCSLGGVNSSNYTLGNDGSATFANGTAGFDSLGNLTATNFTGGGGSSNQLTNGSYSVVLDSLGNTAFPNATVEASGLVVSQGIGSYDTIGVGSTGSLGYGLNNIALNPDGSASFANGAASIDSSGTFSSNGVELANIDRTYPLYQIQQSGATSGQIVRWNGSAWEPVTVTFGSGEFNQSLNTTDDVIFDKIYVGGSGSSDSILKIGPLEFQPYGVNNIWFGDNAYYNGGFYFRNNGSAGLFYFQGANAGGAGEEGQFRMTGLGSAGDSFSPTTQLKIAYTGEFGIGSSINTGTGAFDGSNFYVDSVGNATLAGSITTAPQSAPSSPVAGQIYFDSGDSHFYGYNGTSWVQLDN